MRSGLPTSNGSISTTLSRAVAALGLREEQGRPLVQTIVAAVSGKRMLLILDNCEHLREAAAALAVDLMRAGPSVRMVATSRQALDVVHETVWLVPSLSLPDGTEAAGVRRTAQTIFTAESTRLFCERAALAQPAFALTDQNAGAVAAICRRLDGIPLAIELAAARTRILTPEQIAARLDQRFRLLTSGSEGAPGREQTLRAALDWSYDLLSGAEQQLLQRLSVFPGGCEIEAAETVCGHEPEEDGQLSVFDLLNSLVEKSLVTVAYHCEAARYRLLETVRQYAAERLAATGPEEAVHDRLTTWALVLTERARTGLNGAEQAAWLERLAEEHDNLRAVLARTLEHGDTTRGLAVALPLYRFWLFRGHLTEGRNWLGRLLARGGAPAASRAQANRTSAQLAIFQGAHDAAHAAAEALAIARRMEHRWLEVMALSDLANAVQYQGELETAISYYDDANAVARELGNVNNISVLLGNLALLKIRRGDQTAARPLLEEAIALQRRIGGRGYLPLQLSSLATVLQEESDVAAARQHLEEAIGIAREIGNLDALAACEENLADLERRAGNLAAAESHADTALRLAATLDDGRHRVTVLLTAGRVASAAGRLDQAVRLFGAAHALREAIQYILLPVLEGDVAASVAAMRDRLGHETFAALWTEGAAMSLTRPSPWPSLVPGGPPTERCCAESAGSAIEFPCVGLSARAAMHPDCTTDGECRPPLAPIPVRPPTTLHLRMAFERAPAEVDDGSEDLHPRHP
jgi:predicted ATPase